MEIQDSHRIKVDVETVFIAEQSAPDANRYVFAYTITIRNIGSKAATLLTRHWIINDGNGRRQEVHGEGVVGEQPYLLPGGAFKYTSGTIIETPVGSMEGTYQMVSDDGVPFEATIPAFTLSLPNKLH